MEQFNYKGLIVYPYLQGNKRPQHRLCVADPNHNYPYEAKGVTQAAGFETAEQAKAWIDARA